MFERLLKLEVFRRGIPSPNLSRGRGTRLAFACVLTLGGCNVGPNFHQPGSMTPRGWVRAVQSNYPTSQPKTTTTQPADVATWWRSFNDPLLTSLVERTIAANLDLRQAESRLRQARATLGFTAADEFPTVNTSGGYTRSGNGARGARDSDLYRAGLDASWEIDVFGGVRRNVEASAADVRAAVEDRRDVQVQVASEVAVDYVALRSYQRQLEIARGNLVLQRRNADLVRRLFNGGNGFNSRLDVANADASVAQTASTIPVLERLRRQSIYAIALLMAEEPSALMGELSVPQSIPLAPPEVPIGLPSDLLRRRPDIRRAVDRLHAATARIGVAEADLYPRFSLTGSFAYQSSKPASLLDWSNHFWSVGPAVTWPLFDAGRIRSNIEIQNELELQAVLAYRSTVLTALNDVENSIVAYAQEQEHRAALADAVTANRQAVNLATTLYAQGQTDFLNVLSAQQALFSSEDSLAQSDSAVTTDLIALYKALGGGWEPPAQ